MDHDNNNNEHPPVTISSYHDSLQIVDVFVKDGMDLEKGQPLFVVKRWEDNKAKDGTIIKHWHPYFFPDELRYEVEEAG
ncbi:hypothetical protein Tco_1488546 [Tanacetum coccineum]